MRFAATGDDFCRFIIALAFLLIAGTVGAAHPLKPPDTTSPRATLESFLALTEEAASRYHAFRDAPSPTTQEALWQISLKAARLFDLSQVGPAARPKVADETFYLLWDVIARLELPDLAVRVGDFCRYGEDPSPGWLRIGTVEEIGLRSTRIRGIDRTVTTIPNAEFSNMEIINLTKRDRMVFRPTLALRYETNSDQLRFVLAKLREMLLAHPRVTDDPARVRFAGFGEYALNVETFAYVNTADWNEFLAIQEDINLRIIDIVETAGTGFALPSRTLYHARDGGLDAERQQAAEKQVREWGSAQTLPFPEFADDYRRKIMNTLDYPPTGSPGADRG